MIISLNTSDVTKLPIFIPHQIEEEGISVGALAEKLAVPIKSLAVYNNFDTDHFLHEGESLLVPRK